VDLTRAGAMNILDLILDAGFLAAAIRLTVPLLLGTLGEMICERSGVVNLGIEGMMLAGAFVGFLAASVFGSLWFGVFAAVLVGGVLGFVLAVLVVHLRIDQTVAGIGMTMAITGLVYFTYRLVYFESTMPSIKGFATIPIPLLSKIPIVGDALFNQYALTYLAYLVIPACALFLSRTPAGLSLRTVGENPEAAAGSAIKVMPVRTIALMVAGGFAALAGAYLSLAIFGSFTFGVISGRGWICLALVVLGRWNPVGCTLAALLFGGVDAFQLRMQTSGESQIPFSVFVALPYIATLVAMIVSSRRASAPKSLMHPYDPEER